MKTIQRLIGYLDAVNEATGRAVAWLTLGMVMVTFTVVVLRYAFNIGWIAMQESITYMHAAVFMLGAAYTLKHDGHVRVDIVYRRLSDRGRAWVDLLGTLLLLLPVSGFIVWVSWDYVVSSWALREGSGETGGLPWVYLLKSAIPAMAILMMLQGVALALRSLLVVTGHPEATPEHDPTQEL
ncbi:TRAP transporter small permease subunit [Thiohalomonas denitrificans]|uniref:TRAP transporter small permease protein n=1 Tax=Thiohalomonas denitrificans TaxID=415747 RepID=A0A1G5QRU6_9GAMM|nr:TRAP transporter small permease subunit [Thiohalomonas denitrificans]SCZ64553.1 TRAP-type mannitol/chloroaromatic compound transport system, small permease component [Thiohalomonas denitrificans]